jgi:hypothetical protein
MAENSLTNKGVVMTQDIKEEIVIDKDGLMPEEMRKTSVELLDQKAVPEALAPV